MIAKALFFLLLALSVAFLLSSLRRREGIFEFPTLFAGAFLFSIVPQLVNHVFYPGRLPVRVYQDHGVEYGLIMCILCLVAGIAGYQIRPKRPARRERPAWRIDVDKLFWAGVVLCLIGTFGAARLAALAGGWKAQFVEGGHYDLEWSGAPVIWSYVATLLPLGLLLCFSSTLIKSGLGKWAFALVMMTYPTASIVFLGRRAMVFRLALILLISLWFQRRWAPPRWLAPCGMTLAGMIIILAPHYRTYANQTGDIREAAARVDVRSAIEAYATGDQSEGMDNLIMGIPARLTYLSFTWGSGFWNGVVAYWVPGQIVGRGLKQSLMIRTGVPDGELFSRYCGLGFQYGSFATGPYSAFREFAFLGCLLYFVMGRFYRWLWHRAEKRRDLGAQVLYASCALLGPEAVVNSVLGAFVHFLLPVGVLVPLFWLVRAKRRVLMNPVGSLNVHIWPARPSPHRSQQALFP
jgi:hypothetical protein